jgi:UDP-2,3-diacylglucosamine pyrophosphatase LpxH
MLSHDEILAALEKEFPRNAPGQPANGVFLVARLLEPELTMTDPRPYVFIPDIHLVPSKDADDFPWVTARPVQVDGLTRLAGVLGRLRQIDASLRVWQLGDCFDLWRTGDEGGAVAADVKATLKDQKTLVDALFKGAGAQLLAGNHDQELVDYRWSGGPQALNTVVLDRGASAADIILAHGHQFDPIETLPRQFKEFFARGATQKVPPTPRSMLEAANPHWQPPKPQDPPPSRPGDRNRFLNFDLDPADPLPLAQDTVNVVPYVPVQDPARAFIDSFGGGGRKPTVDGPRQTFFTDISWWAEGLSKDGGNQNVRLVVIGHTHQARIVRGVRPDRSLFVLMDCGAWVDSTFLSNRLDQPIANAQIGVRVGNDLRIYQLGYTVRT